MSAQKRDSVRCHVVDVDGSPVLVRGAGELSAAEQSALAEVIRAARRRAEAEGVGTDA